MSGVVAFAMSADGKKILFSYRPGGTHRYHLYEIDMDGSGLRQVTDPANVDTIAQLGFILLLFLIGLEIDFKKIFGSARRWYVRAYLRVSTSSTTAYFFRELALVDARERATGCCVPFHVAPQAS